MSSLPKLKMPEVVSDFDTTSEPRTRYSWQPRTLSEYREQRDFSSDYRQTNRPKFAQTFSSVESSNSPVRKRRSSLTEHEGTMFKRCRSSMKEPIEQLGNKLSNRLQELSKKGHQNIQAVSLLEQKRFMDIDPSKHFAMLMDKNILSSAEVAINSGLINRFVWLLENPNKALIDSDYHRETNLSTLSFSKMSEVKLRLRSNSTLKLKTSYSMPITTKPKF